MTKLFLDDERVPNQCSTFIWVRSQDRSIYKQDEWSIVRNFKDFCHFITSKDLSYFI